MNAELSRRVAPVTQTTIWARLAPVQQELGRSAFARAADWDHLARAWQAVVLAGEGELDDPPMSSSEWVSIVLGPPTKSAKHNRPGDHPMGGYSPAWQKAVIENTRETVASLAADNNMSVTEYEDAVAAAAKKLLDGALIEKRTHAETVLKILASGRIKSQHETNTSSGALDPDFRAGVEENLMGTPSTMPAEERPIYGYVSANHGDLSSSGFSMLAQYGDVAIVLNNTPELRARTTVTFGDSFGSGATYGPGSAQFVPVPLTNPSIHGMLTDYGDPLDSLKTPDDLDHSFGYVEAQVHGGVRVSDIAEVVFTRGLITGDHGAAAAALDDAGIPWTDPTRQQ